MYSAQTGLIARLYQPDTSRNK